MMGSGKSTVGRLVAGRTGWAYRDNDDLLLAMTGRTPREILAEGDEARLLAAEVRAFEQGVAAPPPSILGVSGRAILDAGARSRLKRSGLVVWLRTTPETIHARALGAPHRPWPDPDRMRWIRAAVRTRDPLYASVADLTLDADATPPEQLADAIEARLHALDGCRGWITSAG